MHVATEKEVDPANLLLLRLTVKGHALPHHLMRPSEAAINQNIPIINLPNVSY